MLSIHDIKRFIQQQQKAGFSRQEIYENARKLKWSIHSLGMLIYYLDPKNPLDRRVTKTAFRHKKNDFWSGDSF